LNRLICPAEDLGGRPVGYTAAAWLGFGEAVAAAAGALTGLLFVALSVKGDALAGSLSLRSRAAQTLVLLIRASPATPDLARARERAPFAATRASL